MLKSTKIKKSLFFFIIIFFIYLSYQFLDNIFDKKLSTYLDKKIWLRIDAAKRILFYNKSHVKKYYNSYNQKYLPETLFLDINFETIKLNFLKQNRDSYNYSFFVEILDDVSVLVVDNYGNFNLLKDILLKNKKKSKDFKKIESNLSAHKILDTFLFNDKIFVSYIHLDNECKKFKIAEAIFDTKFLDFKIFYNNDNCRNTFGGGRMQFYEFQNSEGLIFSLSSSINNKPTKEPQNNKTNYGKILFQSFESDEPIIFSKGHRENQGLVSFDNIILATEHGPKGGDEINKIEYSNNYGWPISSYGVKYGDKINEPYYKITHYNEGFKEPIYVYITAIGISEIIKLPNNFSNFWQNNFIITSLNRGSIFRVKFDKNFDKLILSEEIFIGKRIRDIKYALKSKKIILALETNAEIGILTVKD